MAGVGALVKAMPWIGQGHCLRGVLVDLRGFEPLTSSMPFRNYQTFAGSPNIGPGTCGFGCIASLILLLLPFAFRQQFLDRVCNARSLLDSDPLE